MIKKLVLDFPPHENIYKNLKKNPTVILRKYAVASARL
jgi:hypothetical protein